MIRTWQPGDEDAQVSVFNTITGVMPGFKPAKPEDIRRRSRSRDFDPELRFLAEVNGRVVGYCNAQSIGRISYPWCLPGYEGCVEPLFDTAIEALIERGVRRAFAAYRDDWQSVRGFLVEHEFVEVRQMINFIMPLSDSPTLTGTVSRPITSLHADDIPLIAAIGADVLRIGQTELVRYLFANPFFSAESVFVMRDRDGKDIVALGLLIEDASYADPRQVDPTMPCFRLGAFGTEGMSTKRINGLFSFLVAPKADVTTIGLDLLTHVFDRMEESPTEVLAAQVPSDATRLRSFYERFFRKQGSFPIFERVLHP